MRFITALMLASLPLTTFAADFGPGLGMHEGTDKDGQKCAISVSNDQSTLYVEGFRTESNYTIPHYISTSISSADKLKMQEENLPNNPKLRWAASDGNSYSDRILIYMKNDQQIDHVDFFCRGSDLLLRCNF